MIVMLQNPSGRAAWFLVLAAAMVSAPTAQAGATPPRVTATTSPASRAPVRLVGQILPWQRRARVGMRVARPASLNGGPGLLAATNPVQQVTLPGLTPRQMRELGLRPPGQGLTSLETWPPEPAAPAVWDEKRFAAALEQLCPVQVTPRQLKQYAGWILRYSLAYGVDPSLLGALIYQQSRCAARRRTDYGLGLAMINIPMHRTFLREGWYHFMAARGGRWERRTLVLNRFPFSHRSLLNPEANIYFAAGLLSVFQHQCPGIDRPTGSTGHRHPVAHFIWGDRVRDAGVEDRILRDRRRLLALYHRKLEPALGRLGGLALGCPLFGCPRKVTSVVGDDRDDGQRRHNGIDVMSDQAEAVRAIAPGEVILAGVDLGEQGLRNLDPSRTGMVPHGLMGPRGLLVKIRHPGGLISEYMHLSAYPVTVGQRVSRGEIIGHVGRTGMKESDAHLHMGLISGGLHIDPMPRLGRHLLHPLITELGRRRSALQEKRRIQQSRRRHGKGDRLVLPAWASEASGQP